MNALSCKCKLLLSSLCSLLITSLFGHIATTEGDPSALVDGIVNVITGDLYALEEDIVIQGVEPLRIKRSYVSAKGTGNWSFFENFSAVRFVRTYSAYINEPNGTTLIYRYDLDELKHKKKKDDFIFHPLNLNREALGFTNTARGAISANTNLKNQIVRMNKEGDLLSVICPNATKRIYRPTKGQKPTTLPNGKKAFETYHYLLHSEELPNGNKIIYHWNDKNTLVSIRTTDPSGQKTYAEARFEYFGKWRKNRNDKQYCDNPNFNIHTSDGRILQYQFFCEGDIKHGGTWYLNRIVSSEDPAEVIHYLGKEPYRNRLLSTIALPQSRHLHVSYYHPGVNDNGVHVKGIQDPLCCNVKALSSPVGTKAEALFTHKFFYFPPEKKTIVYDADDIPTHYYWDDHLRLTRIDRFSDSQTLYNSTLFVWGADHSSEAGNLLCRVFCDEHRHPLHATRYIYDARGNVLQEKFYGNLSGTSSPLILDSRQLPLENGEVYTKTFAYTQDGKSLLLCKQEDNGLTITYDYLPGSNLPICELTYEKEKIKRRKFYEYNADRILIREIVDDGTTSYKDDLSHVKTRRIKQITPKSNNPFFGMPQIIEEKFWDGSKEILLKKIILHYTTGGRIAQKDVYDACDILSYHLTYHYDSKGRLIEESNALGQICKSSYDELGNKIFFQDFGANTSLHMAYDFSNRLIETQEEGFDGLVRVTSHSYNKKHHKTKTIDPYRYETQYVYNALGQITETHLPPLNTLSPVLYSTYDAKGCETSYTDGKGYSTLTTHNAYDRPISIRHPDGTQEKFIYNNDGTLQCHIDQNEAEIHYSYDIFGRTTSKVISKNGETFSQESWGYDAFQLVCHTDCEGHCTIFEYDGAGRKIAEECGDERSAKSLKSAVMSALSFFMMTLAVFT
jgi:YD repeat-containing protein